MKVATSSRACDRSRGLKYFRTGFYRLYDGYQWCGFYIKVWNRLNLGFHLRSGRRGTRKGKSPRSKRPNSLRPKNPRPKNQRLLRHTKPQRPKKLPRTETLQRPPTPRPSKTQQRSEKLPRTRTLQRPPTPRPSKTQQRSDKLPRSGTPRRPRRPNTTRRPRPEKKTGVSPLCNSQSTRSSWNPDINPGI